MKDLGWVQKNLIPHLIDYTIECNYYSEGDFGSLYAITFESSQKGGYIHFGVQVGLESMFMIMKKMKRFLMFY